MKDIRIELSRQSAPGGNRDRTASQRSTIRLKSPSVDIGGPGIHAVGEEQRARSRFGQAQPGEAFIQAEHVQIGRSADVPHSVCLQEDVSIDERAAAAALSDVAAGDFNWVGSWIEGDVVGGIE